MINDLKQHIEDIGVDAFKKLCYEFSRQLSYACVLDSCKYKNPFNQFEFLAAFGAETVIDSFKREQIDALYQSEWVFGLWSYELKNQFEALESARKNTLEQPECALFIPETILAIDYQGKPSMIKGELPSSFFAQVDSDPIGKWQLNSLPAESRENYLGKIQQIREYILEGEVYELNYCRENLAEVSDFDPVNFHQDLIKGSPVPMASYLRFGNQHLCSVSMERFLLRQGMKLISQPIKGTIKRDLEPERDQELAEQLKNSEKDRAENVMIVDLVRNDLGKICKAGTIKVDELFGIYTFPHVHQMISTISGQLKDGIGFSQILQACFPMGSMTGTPKIAAMKKIEELEEFKRSWYSGSIGYLRPNGDFDLAVIIRTLFYNEDKEMISYSTGGAITIDSEPEREWEECLLKAKAIESVLFNK